MKNSFSHSSLNNFYKDHIQSHENYLFDLKKRSFSKTSSVKNPSAFSKSIQEKTTMVSEGRNRRLIKSNSQQNFDFNIFAQYKEKIEEEINEKIIQKNIELKDIMLRISQFKSKINFFKSKEKVLEDYNSHSQLPSSIINKINLIKLENDKNLPGQITNLKSLIEINFEKHETIRDEYKKNKLLIECNKKEIKNLLEEINNYKSLIKEDNKLLMNLKIEYSKYKKLNTNTNFRIDTNDKILGFRKELNQKELNKKFSDLINYIK